jgi:hypothetical protein
MNSDIVLSILSDLEFLSYHNVDASVIEFSVVGFISEDRTLDIALSWHHIRDSSPPDNADNSADQEDD